MTGKEAGAPVKANTGYFSGGYLQKNQFNIFIIAASELLKGPILSLKNLR